MQTKDVINSKLVEEKIAPESLTIEGISQPVLVRYFETFNGGEFAETAALFASEGILNAPFEEPIVGRDAIAAYLDAEARGMQLFPRKGRVEPSEDNQTQVEVKGHVQTPWFSVNVGWIFLLNAQQEILSVTVKLLASLEELVKIRR